MTDKIVVLSTCASEEEAGRLANLLLERRLAACVNILPSVKSVYRWKGEIESAPECLLIIKSARAQFDALRAALESAHSYELPEALALPVIDGSPAYLEWLAGSLQAEAESDGRAEPDGNPQVEVESSPGTQS
jgi:periplasmic divalent cation tolerance protein